MQDSPVRRGGTSHRSLRKMFLHIIVPHGVLIDFLRHATLASLSVLRNPRWPPKWPPKSLTSYIFVIINDIIMILVSRCMFSQVRDPNMIIKSSYSEQFCRNPRWPPKWPAECSTRYIFVPINDIIMILVSRCMFLWIRNPNMIATLSYSEWF